MTDDANAPTLAETVHVASSDVPRPPEARYAMQRMIGRGGMGEVWLARDRRIDRDIAIKMMRGDAGHDPDAVARFLREARVQGRLEHPSVVPVHDLGGDDASPYFAMKRLTGTTLADVLVTRGPAWSRRTLLARLVDICLAAEFAHQRGVIHRDLKPANIMLGDFGEAYVLDWGLARIADVADTGAIHTSDLRSDSGSGGQTVAGAMLGTPGYMAPEQMRGEPVDQRTDVYALGCILFEILVGELAVPRDQAFEVTLAAPCFRPAARRPDAEIPPELDDACARATASDPAHRTASARDLADDIQRFLDGDRDLEVRRELAATHSARALDVFERKGDAGRAEAMREAGRAIALDASSVEAQTILARLLLEPPREIPPAARQKIDEDREISARALLRAVARAYAVNLLFIPLAKLLGVGGVWPFVVIGSMVTVLIATCLLTARTTGPINRYVIGFVVIVHVTAIATVGLFFGSLMFLPLFAFGSIPLMLLMPTLTFPKRALVLHLLAVAIPVALEWTGVLPRSFTFVDGAIVFRPWAVSVSPMSLVIAFLIIIAVQMSITVYVISDQRKNQETAQEQLHVQAWQLAQLVSTK